MEAGIERNVKSFILPTSIMESNLALYNFKRLCVGREPNKLRVHNAHQFAVAIRADNFMLKMVMFVKVSGISNITDDLIKTFDKQKPTSIQIFLFTCEVALVGDLWCKEN